MKCVICNSEKLNLIKSNYKPYLDYQYEIFDCQNCQARFVSPFENKNVHEDLHKFKGNIYDLERENLNKAKYFFNNKDIKGYRKFLSKDFRYKFIINKIEKIGNKNIKLLEIGCSFGYLTAYFILNGYNSIGIDVSETAIVNAKKTFGNDNFKCSSIEELSEKEKYHVIYHTGLIGVVNNPREVMIKSINLLEKNGITIFNAPNKKRALLKNIPWISGCAPPDLRTLFLPETFSIFIKNKPLLLNMVHIKPKIEKGGWFISKIKGIKEMPFSVNSKFLDYKLPQTKSKKINLFKNIIVIIIGIFVPNFFYESDFGLFVIIKNKQK